MKGTLLRDLGRAVWLRGAGKASIAMLGSVLIIVAIGPILAPYSPTDIGVGPPIAGPSVPHPLGTDTFGRDVLSRFLWGGRTLVTLTLISTTIAFIIGTMLGMLAALEGGIVDGVISRLADVGLSLPPLLIGLVLLMSIGYGSGTVGLVVVLFFVPRITTVVRGAALKVVKQEYILAARARGESRLGILVREVFPNIVGPAVAEYALRFGYAAVFISTLNFLGLGVQPPTPDWGLMVNEGRSILTQVPWGVLVPSAAISVLGIGASLLGDSISHAMAGGTAGESQAMLVGDRHLRTVTGSEEG